MNDENLCSCPENLVCLQGSIHPNSATNPARSLTEWEQRLDPWERLVGRTHREGQAVDCTIDIDIKEK